MSETWRPFESDRDACKQADQSARLEAISYSGDCQHQDTFRGADAPRVHGSDRTEVCRGCGSFRRRDHHDKIRGDWHGRWRPASDYADETLECEEP